MRNNPHPDDVLEKIDADAVETEEVIPPITQRRNRPQQPPPPYKPRQVNTEPVPQQRPKRVRLRTFRNVCVCVCGFLIMGILISAAFWVWHVYTQVENQWHYGDAHVSQFDADVGHGGTSHFLTTYYHGYVIVIEFYHGDSNKYAIYYKRATFDNNDKTPRSVTLQVQTIDGHRDLLAFIDGASFPIVFTNLGDKFDSEAS